MPLIFSLPSFRDADKKMRHAYAAADALSFSLIRLRRRAAR